jgi:hypothetical protein
VDAQPASAVLAKTIMPSKKKARGRSFGWYAYMAIVPVSAA